MLRINFLMRCLLYHKAAQVSTRRVLWVYVRIVVNQAARLGEV